MTEHVIKLILSECFPMHTAKCFTWTGSFNPCNSMSRYIPTLPPPPRPFCKCGKLSVFTFTKLRSHFSPKCIHRTLTVTVDNKLRTPQALTDGQRMWEEPPFLYAKHSARPLSNSVPTTLLLLEENRRLREVANSCLSRLFLAARPYARCFSVVFSNMNRLFIHKESKKINK